MASLVPFSELMLGTPNHDCACERVMIAPFHPIPHARPTLSLSALLDYHAMVQFALGEALADLADGVIILSRHGQLVFMSESARALLETGDGLRLSDGLVASRMTETRRLRRLVADATTEGAMPCSRMLVSRPSGLRPIMVRVTPLPATDHVGSTRTPYCLLLLHDLANVNLPSRATLVEIFGLSPREVDLIIELVRHTNLEVAASAAHMAFNTARIHLHNIFRKCNVSTQAQALQLFARLR